MFIPGENIFNILIFSICTPSQVPYAAPVTEHVHSRSLG